MQDRVFYSSCFGFISGVFLRSFALLDIYLVAFLGVIFLFLLLFFYFIAPNKLGVVISVFILTFSFGVFYFHSADVSAPEFFESQVGGSVEVNGLIVDEIDTRENNQRLTVLVQAEQDTKVLVSVNLGEDFKYGDSVRIEGVLNKPENFITDQGKEFDYINYLRKDGIFYLINYPDVTIVSRGQGSKIKSTLFYIKGKFLEKISFAIRDPESLLMGGLILGERSSFGQGLRQDFVDTGTIHIVALSGYNVTIIAEWFMKLFSFLSINTAIGMGVFAIIIFVTMAGGSSTAIRAGAMAILALIARATGRNYDVARALVLVGVIMILINPFILFFDVSFQLSFIATVAVIFFAPRIEKYFYWITKKGQLRDIISVTCACYVFVLPFILYKMGNLSVVALPANILILPFIPFTMGLGFLTGFLGLIWYGLSVPVGYVSYLLLHYELAVVSYFADFSFASFSFPNFPLWITILIYAYFAYILFGRNIKNFFTGMT